MQGPLRLLQAWSKLASWQWRWPSSLDEDEVDDRKDFKKLQKLKEERDILYHRIKTQIDLDARLKKKHDTRKEKDAAFVDRVKKGVKFYDKKGSGRIVGGKKRYD